MIVFDYNVLADDSHRRNFYKATHIQWEQNCPGCFETVPKNADGSNFLGQDLEAYYAAADKDTPIEATLSILKYFTEDRYSSDGICYGPDKDVQVWCNIPQAHGNSMVPFFKKYIPFVGIADTKLRPDGDTTPWHELKLAWLQEYLKYPELPSHPSDKTFTRKDKPEMAFERTESPMIPIWKKYGVPVFEVYV